MKAGWALADPSQKRRKPRMVAQGRDGVEAARQFGFGQGGMDFIMTDLMQQHDRPALAAAQLRRQVMQALLGILRNGAIAKWADGCVIHYRQEWRADAPRQGGGRHG